MSLLCAGFAFGKSSNEEDNVLLSDLPAARERHITHILTERPISTINLIGRLCPLCLRVVDTEMQSLLCRQEKENSRRERAQAKVVQQQQQTPAACEAHQEKATQQPPASGTPRVVLKGSSFFSNGRNQVLPNGPASEPRTHYRWGFASAKNDVLSCLRHDLD